MKAIARLETLEDQQRDELKRLRSHIHHAANTLERDASPARWIGKHPYLATGAAAILGFITAQRTAKSSSPAAPSAPAPPLQAQLPPPAPRFDFASLLPVLMDIAQQIFPPALPCTPDPAGPSLAPGDAGSVMGPVIFLHSPCAAECPPASAP